MGSFVDNGSIATRDDFKSRVAYAMGIAAAAVYNEALVANAVTAAGSAVLHFASVPGSIVAGLPANDLTAPGVIPAGTTVLSTTATSVTLSANVTGAGVGVGDSIAFVNGHAARAAFAVKVANGNYNLAAAALLVLGNSAIGAEANINTANGYAIPDADIQFAVNSLWNVLAGA